MTLATIRIVDERQRAHIADLAYRFPPGTICKFSEPTRTLEQNAKLWAMLSDVASARPDGRQWPTETWKAAFMHLSGHQMRFADGLDGTGPFPLGYRSSGLSVREMADLITVVQEYGDRHGVVWKERNRWE